MRRFQPDRLLVGWTLKSTPLRGWQVRSCAWEAHRVLMNHIFTGVVSAAKSLAAALVIRRSIDNGQAVATPMRGIPPKEPAFADTNYCYRKALPR